MLLDIPNIISEIHAICMVKRASLNAALTLPLDPY